MKLGRFEIDNIYNEDCYEAIKDIPDRSIDLIITDPPYEVETNGGNTNIGSSLKNGMCKELEESEIVSGINEEILDEFMRVLKKPNIYIWCNKKQIPMYLDYFVNKHKCKFEIMVWIKSNPTPLCGGNYLIDKEFCLYFRDGIKLNTTFETASTYWISTKNKNDKDKFDHPTIKPTKIIENLIKNSSNENELILDCFMGSGTTAVASKNTNRHFLGFEINNKWWNVATDRLNNTDASGQTSMFLI